MKKLYKVGIYCRLSVDDASNSAKVKNYIPADESASIENQYELLSKFVMLNGWTEVKTYRDDGYSGGNFQRPGFLEMLEDARHGLINLILVKDLSRLAVILWRSDAIPTLFSPRWAAASYPSLTASTPRATTQICCTSAV